jgi:predicted dehydrogenase
MSNTCNVALIGQKFMGRAHSNAYLKASRFFNLPIQPVMHTIAGVDLVSLAPFADRWGWKHYSTSWKEVVKAPDIDLVDISTPNYMHAEQAVAALAAGKHVACEKPLGATLRDAKAMKNAALRAKRSKTFVWFNYRRCPAVAWRTAGRRGANRRIYHVRAATCRSGADRKPLSSATRRSTRLLPMATERAYRDMARFITGQDIVEVSGAISETFITERPLPNTGKSAHGSPSRRKRDVGKSDVDDTVLFLARFSGGAVGSFEATRLAAGHENDNQIEINGSLGSLRFNFEDMNVLWYFVARKAAHGLAGGIMCTSAGNHPYAGAWWPDGHIIGYEHTFVNMVADMMAVLAGEQPIVPLPDFADAFETQRVLEAAMLAAKHRAAVKLSEIK